MNDSVFLFEYENIKGIDLMAHITLRQKSDSELKLINEKTSELSGKALEYYLLSEKYRGEDVTEIMDISEKCKKSENILYGTDSDIPVGYFCSDPIYDLVVGNTKRGKLSKKKPLTGYYHTYYFDNNRLIKDETPGASYTLFFYKENTVYEVHFVGKDLYNITECIYDEENRIVKRTVFSAHFADKMFFMFIVGSVKPMVIRDKNKGLDFIFEINEQQFCYTGDRISSVEYSEYHSFASAVRYERYDFSFIGEYYSEYNLFNYLTEQNSSFKPLKKRKYFEFIKPPRYSDYR